VTPIAVERDSRTFKQAASFANLGYRSIVVEGERSDLEAADLPFELTAMEGAPSPWTGAPLADESEEPAPAPTAKSRRLILRLQMQYNRRTYRSLPAAELYVLHGYMQFPGVLAAAFRNRARIAYDAHDAYFALRPGQLDDDEVPWQRFWQRVERLAVRVATGFATVSDGLAETLRARHGRRPVTIRNLHDFRLDRETDRDLRARTGVSADDFLLVSIGNDKDGMAVEQALEALRSLPDDVHIAWVGRGFERHRVRAEELGVAGRAHFVGAVSPTTVVSLARSADAAVVLYWPITENYRDALPNGYFQSLAAGLPVLYSPELVEVHALTERYGFGLGFDPRRPASLADAVGELRDEGRLAELRSGAERAGEELNWEREEERLASHVAATLRGDRRT
jgi:glycosyltransferase involved in cell wall biosynthesis